MTNWLRGCMNDRVRGTPDRPSSDPVAAILATAQAI